MKALDVLKRAAPPVLLLGLLLALWEGLVRAMSVPDYLVPAPSAIAAALASDGPLLFGSALVTLRITLGAFLLALVAGVGLAVAFSASRILAGAAIPLVIALQVTPVIAIAPLVIIWVGIDRPQTAMLLLAGIVAFFPILSNAMIGLASADRGLRALFKLYGAGPLLTFWRLELPSALPYLLSGMKISGGLALVGAVVAEFVAGTGASQGLAWRIIEAGNRLQIPRLFAALLLLTAMGLLIYGALALLQRALLGKWHESSS